MEPSGLDEFAAKVRGQLLDHIMPFWCGPALDHEQGGWLAWLSNNLQPDFSRPKGLIVNSRILWTFSAVDRAHPDRNFQQMADRAFAVVMNQFWDGLHGGAFWQLAGNGQVLDDSKKTYGQAFYIYALTEYHRAFDSLPALSRAKQLFELVEQHCHDPLHGGYWEVRCRDWSEATDTRLSAKDMNEKKSMNNHLHLLEAYTNLYRVWPDNRVQRRLRELIALFQSRILDQATFHFHHFFDDAWQVRSNSYTFGHDIEGSWLLCEAAEALHDQTLLCEVQKIALNMAETVCREGLGDDGGLYYEGRGGTIVDRRKEWWPQAEAVVGFVNAFQLSTEGRYLQAARKLWDYIELQLVDREFGEWFWRINDDGQPDRQLPKVSEWKGPYHNSRACLEVMSRLQIIKQKLSRTIPTTC